MCFAIEQREFIFYGTEWFTPVILATWEAEIWRIAVPASPREKKNLRDSISMEKKAGCGGAHLLSQQQWEV
jgi:hypothetical protein